MAQRRSRAFGTATSSFGGALRLERRGVYRALVSEDEYGRRSALSLVDKVFAGSASKLMAALVAEGRLSAADAAELSALLRGPAKEDSP